MHCDRNRDGCPLIQLQFGTSACTSVVFVAPALDFEHGLPEATFLSPKIFISYRRDDGGYVASTLHDSLAARFGRDAVQRDIDMLEVGMSLEGRIKDTINNSTVVVAIIGPAWLSSESADGRRRIDDPGDFVRLELEIALAHGIPVIPVLVGDARMPSSAELPSGLEQLAWLNAVEIRSGRDMAESIARLAQAIQHFADKGNPSAAVLQEPILSHTEVQTLENGKAFSGAEQPIGSVFISYRRDGGADTARLMRYELQARGWQVFLDAEDLNSGRFDENLLANVAAADNFLLILSKGSLANCANEDDWLRREIATAIQTERNIIPLLKERAQPPDKYELPADIAPVGKFNCVNYSHAYYNATIARLLSFLRKRGV